MIDKIINQETMVISAFPGTGKSYATKKLDNVVDSDSSKFDKVNFPANYIEYIKDEIEQKTSVIFVSTHQEVRDALVKADIPFILIYPDISLKEEYLRRYKKRKSPQSFINLLDEKWDDWITSCEIQSNNYTIKLTIY